MELGIGSRSQMDPQGRRRQIPGGSNRFPSPNRGQFRQNESCAERKIDDLKPQQSLARGEDFSGQPSTSSFNVVLGCMLEP